MIRYTALGDSITAGENASSLRLAYPFLIQAVLRKRGQPSVLHVLAEPGWNSQALVTAVLQNQAGPLCNSTTISIWTGGNDLIEAGMAVLNGAPSIAIQRSLQRYGKDLETLVRLIQKCSTSRIVICTQYNPFPNSLIVTEAIGSLNSVTESATQRMGIELAPVHVWFEGRQAEFAGYQNGRIEDVLQRHVVPIHPNNVGHRVIANHLLPYIR